MPRCGVRRGRHLTIDPSATASTVSVRNPSDAAYTEQGKLDDAAAALSHVRSGPRPGSVVSRLPARQSGAPAHPQGDVAGGRDGLLEVARLFAAVGRSEPALVTWRSQAALACLRLGDDDEARRLATEELALARALWVRPGRSAQPSAQWD